jgi:hypothetical protein
VKVIWRRQDMEDITLALTHAADLYADASRDENNRDGIYKMECRAVSLRMEKLKERFE